MRQKEATEMCDRTKMEISAECLVTSDSITVYFEKPESLPAEYRYQFVLNEAVAGESDKTHFLLEGLDSDTEYDVQVKVTGSGGTAAQSPIYRLRTRAAGARLDVTKAPYRAAGDGSAMDTQAIQRAIDDCGSGGVVYLPAGIYRTGALRLHSDMELYLEEGAVLQGTDDPEDYLPRIWSRFEGTELSCYSSLLNMGELNHEGGANCENILIRGKGTIASGGRPLAERVIALETERMKDELAALGDKINECEKAETIPGRVRPRLINISNCRNVRISGVTLKNGASWNVHMIYSEGIVTDNCKFYSEDVWNGDGWDPDSSVNCTIFGCLFYTGDDSVAIKSGKNPEGNVIGRPSRTIKIFDCKCAFGHGITIGSEMSGGVEDVKIWDCDMGASLYGIEIKGTKKRGGYVRGIQVRDCTIARLLFHSVGYNDDGIGAGTAPVFADCAFENVRITGRCLDHDGKYYETDCMELIGFDEPEHALRNILLKNITLGAAGEARPQRLVLSACEGITISNLKCF
ncbi:MAG: glycoside hydrolase family 28 protein [Roseburia sp.]|nr:glycoside hydrolase family 28 protein [Roseburia sp.]